MRDEVCHRLDAGEIRAELARVLDSRVFRAALRSQRLLTYLVEGALAEPPVVAKEYTLALDVFDRTQTYDPSVDATVRVEASRLRTRLREYYDEEGRYDPWLIEVPKGRYAVSLQQRPELLPPHPAPEPAAPSLETRESVAEAGRGAGRYAWAFCLVTLLSGMVFAASHAYRHTQAQSSQRLSAQAAAQAATPAAAQSRSLAILPIANGTHDPAMTYVADGLTDDLIRQLSQVPALKLIARTTVFHDRNRAADPRALARSLGVDAVMTSELRRTPDHTALTVEMIDVHDGSVILDREYMADADDLRSVQAEVQQDILKRLHVEGSARDPAHLLHSVTASPQAYREFLTADALARSGTPADLHQAILHTQNAVALDPKFDLAWAALASEHLFLGIYFEPPREQMPLARQFAQRALARVPTLAKRMEALALFTCCMTGTSRRPTQR